MKGGRGQMEQLEECTQNKTELNQVSIEPMKGLNQVYIRNKPTPTVNLN